MDDNTLLLASRGHQRPCGEALGIGKEGLRYGAPQITFFLVERIKMNRTERQRPS